MLNTRSAYFRWQRNLASSNLMRKQVDRILTTSSGERLRFFGKDRNTILRGFKSHGNEGLSQLIDIRLS